MLLLFEWRQCVAQWATSRGPCLRVQRACPGWSPSVWSRSPEFGAAGDLSTGIAEGSLVLSLGFGGAVKIQRACGPLGLLVEEVVECVALRSSTGGILRLS
jgi:hypothetical protein